MNSGLKHGGLDKIDFGPYIDSDVTSFIHCDIVEGVNMKGVAIRSFKGGVFAGEVKVVVVQEVKLLFFFQFAGLGHEGDGGKRQQLN